MNNIKVLEKLQKISDTRVDLINSYSSSDEIEYKEVKVNDTFLLIESDEDGVCELYFKLLESNNKLYMIGFDEVEGDNFEGINFDEYKALNDHKVKELEEYLCDLIHI